MSYAFSNCATRGSICPSIYSQLDINVSGYENANLAVPSTDIPLRVGIQLCSLRKLEQALMLLRSYKIGSSKNLSAVGQPMSWQVYPSEAFSTEGTCCGLNQYYEYSTVTCTACPTGSVAKYRGLLCGFIHAGFAKTVKYEVCESGVRSQYLLAFSTAINISLR